MAGALGPAQFMPATWASWGRDDDRNGRASPYDVGDAVMAMGRLMCSLIVTAKASGIPGDSVSLALAGYNAGWGAVQQAHGVPAFAETTAYVQKVTRLAFRWTDARAASGLVVGGTSPGAAAVARAATVLGQPYVYGGGSPAGPTVGFCDGSRGVLGGVCFASSHAGWDCSSLAQFAWWPTLHLPRTAAQQYAATAARTVALSEIQPGDLIFYAHGSGIDHVAIAIGGGRVIQAPSTGRNVESVALYTQGFVAITRPA